MLDLVETETIVKLPPQNTTANKYFYLTCILMVGKSLNQLVDGTGLDKSFITTLKFSFLSLIK